MDAERDVRRRVEEGLERLEGLERGLRDLRELLGGKRVEGKGKEPAEGPRVSRG